MKKGVFGSSIYEDLEKGVIPSWMGGKKVKRIPSEKPKIIYLVTDTSWWMDRGWEIATEVAERLKDGEPFFLVPNGVMRELDGLKKADGDKGRKALESTKRIHELVSMGRCRIVKGNEAVEGILASKVDEEVVSVAKEWKEKGETYLLTTDRAQMAVAEGKGLYVGLLYLIERDPIWKALDKLPLVIRFFVMTFGLPLLYLHYKTVYKEPVVYSIHKGKSLSKLLAEEDDHFPGNVGCPCPVCSDDDD